MYGVVMVILDAVRTWSMAAVLFASFVHASQLCYRAWRVSGFQPLRRHALGMACGALSVVVLLPSFVGVNSRTSVVALLTASLALVTACAALNVTAWARAIRLDPTGGRYSERLERVAARGPTNWLLRVLGIIRRNPPCTETLSASYPCGLASSLCSPLVLVAWSSYLVFTSYSRFLAEDAGSLPGTAAEAWQWWSVLAAHLPSVPILLAWVYVYFVILLTWGRIPALGAQDDGSENDEAVS